MLMPAVEAGGNWDTPGDTDTGKAVLGSSLCHKDTGSVSAILESSPSHISTRGLAAPAGWHQPWNPLSPQTDTLGPIPVHQQVRATLGPPGLCSQLCQEPALPTIRLTQPQVSLGPTATYLRTPPWPPMSQLQPQDPLNCLTSQDPASLINGPGATTLDRAWQPTGPGASPDYQHTHSGQPNHNRRIHAAHSVVPSEYSALGTREKCALGPHWTSALEATSPRSGNITNLPDTS